MLRIWVLVSEELGKSKVRRRRRERGERRKERRGKRGAGREKIIKTEGGRGKAKSSDGV
jgi:hypothetical protein